MSGLLEMLSSQLGGDTAQRIGARLGADPNATQSALSAALPLLMGALARNSANPSGAESLHGALHRDHDGGVLDNLQTAIDQPDEHAGNGILRHVLGTRRQAVEAGVSKASGLSGAQAGALLTMLAPMVMAALGKTQREQGLSASGLGALLGTERQGAEQAMPGAAGLMRLLDSDGDGQIADEIGRIGKGLLGGLFGR